MQCKTACGADVAGVESIPAHLCEVHYREFLYRSGEGARWLRNTGAQRDAALVDFCNRVRAERRPEVQR